MIPHDLKQVAEPWRQPWNAVCHLSIVWPDGRRSAGSGWLRNERLLITAAHFVFDARRGGWAASVAITTGRRPTGQPIGTWSASAHQLRASFSPAESPVGSSHLGAILFPSEESAKNILGYFDLDDEEPLRAPGRPVLLAAYPPGREAGATLWVCQRTVASVDTGCLVLDADVPIAHAGAPVLFADDFGMAVVGAYVPELDSGTGEVAATNRVVRVSRDTSMGQQVESWERESLRA